MQIEIRSPSRTKEHQSGFPQILQGLRRLTRPKTYDVDVSMASSCQPRYFQIEKIVQSGSPDTRIGTNPSSAASNNNILSDATAELARCV